MNKPTSISQRILQAHCQSCTSQRFNQSFVKELANPTHNRLTNRTEEEHRTDNTGLAKVAVQCSADKFVVNQSLVLRINICGDNRHCAKRQTVICKCTKPQIKKTDKYKLHKLKWLNIDLYFAKKHETKSIIKKEFKNEKKKIGNAINKYCDNTKFLFTKQYKFLNNRF
jgi:hypothetical protein